MSNESRKDPRAKFPGVRAKYERADGAASDDEVRNLGRGGLFIVTTTPLAVGKLVHVEIFLPNDATPLGATGRVIWIREIAVNEDRPAGMGVKLIDVDEGALEVISRMLRERVPSVYPPGAAPTRERTIMGVGLPAPEPEVKARRETIAGIAPEAAPPPSPAPAPVAKSEPPPADATPIAKTKPAEPVAKPKPEAKPAPVASTKPEKRGGSGIWLVVILVAVVVGAFLYGDRILRLIGK